MERRQHRRVPVQVQGFLLGGTLMKPKRGPSTSQSVASSSTASLKSFPAR